MSVARSNPAYVVPAVDPFGREVRSLRLSVTQKCDLRCSHCHKEGQHPASTEMTSSEIERLVKIGATIGVRKVKITGGEPLLRRDISDIVSGISPLLREVSLTTNGRRLSELAVSLKRAGLRRVNVSLHTLDAGRYTRLCGVDASSETMEGIKAAVSVGLDPVKVNMVVLKNVNEDEIQAMIDFCGRAGAVLQLIEYMSDRDGENGCGFAERHVSLKSIEESLARESLETTVNELHRRRRYRIRSNGVQVQVEVVRPMHNSEFCANCTRLRMSSDGRLKPCLLDRSGEVDVLSALREGASDDAIHELFLSAVANRKPYWR